MSNISITHSPLYLSQKFYYFITDGLGNVLHANAPAKFLIEDKIDIDAINFNSQQSQQITLTHKQLSIDWEILPETNILGETDYHWIAVKKNDIDENKEKLKILASLVEQTSDILTAADLEFKPITWNKASEEIYGITAAQAIGAEIRELVNISYPYATREEIRKEIESKGEWRGEMCFNRLTDNKFITLLITFKLLKDEYQNKLGYLISGIDISAIKETELKLKESENRFREVSDSAPVCIWMCNADNKLYYANKPLIDFTGIKDDLTSESWASIIHPEDVEATVEKLVNHMQEKIPVKVICRLKNRDGEYVWMQCTGLPRFLNNGTYIGYIGSIIDINETKIKEEQFYSQATILDNVTDIIVTTDLDFKIQSFNKAAEEYYGQKYKDVAGKLISNVVDLKFMQGTKEEALKQFLQNGKWTGEVSFQNKNNETIYLLSTVTFVYNAKGQKSGVLSLSRDITDRKRIEEKLIKSEAFYRSLIADSLDGMILADAKGTITFVSPPVKTILGYEIDEVLGKNTLDFVHPDDKILAGESFQKEVVEAPEIKFIVVRLLKKSGEWLWCMVRGHNQLANPAIGSMIVYFHDDTLRKEATQALKESEQRFKKIVSNLQFGVVMQNTEGDVLMCNKNILNIFNLKDEKALVGKKISEVLESIITEDGLPAEKEDLPLMKAIKERKPVQNVVLGIHHNSFPEKKWILVSSDPIIDENGKLLHVICTITDITERKKLEQQLIREKVNHQKLLTQASIDGQEVERREIGKELHDNIGQQLTTTKLFLELAKSTADDTTAEMVNLALKGVSDVINEVRGISRALVPHALGDLGLVDSVNDLIETLQRSQKLSVEFDHFYFNEEAVPENQKLMLFRVIQEQLNNIVKHANAAQVNISIKNTGKDLELEIKDDGSGFDLKTVKKGLGLMNIKNRVEMFDGSLHVFASPGKGCIINIQIPPKLPY